MAGLKTEADIRRALSRRLSQCFVAEAAGICTEWPFVLPLGHPSREALLGGLGELGVLTQTLRAWDQELGTTTTYTMRDAGGPKRVPTHLSGPTADVAARIAEPRRGEPWKRILDRTRRRAHTVRTQFPQLDDTVVARILKALDGCNDLECEQVLSAGAWFSAHDARGLTLRQVPIPGIDSKWLDNKRRRNLVCLLAGKEELGLAGWAPSVQLAYLDPDHLAHGGRHFDSWVCGDVITLAYVPERVIIVENKDTYRCFPQVERSICVFGSGFAGLSVVGELPWVRDADEVVYWGDLDADGFEILNAYRVAGIECRSILMDVPTLERFGRYGTNLEKDHKTRILRQRKELSLLSADERAAYELITDPAYTGNRRLEQERIPLAEARAAL